MRNKGRCVLGLGMELEPCPELSFAKVREGSHVGVCWDRAPIVLEPYWLGCSLSKVEDLLVVHGKGLDGGGGGE